MIVALYARVSTADQSVENQLPELHRYAAARGWEPREYLDHAVSGSKDRRPSLDAMMIDARRRRIDAVIVWRLDRLGRNIKHLITVIDEMQALGVAFISLGEGLDTTTPAGRLQFHILASIAQFERERIQERVRAGLARAKAQGKRLGRPAEDVPLDKLVSVAGLKHADAAKQLGVSLSTIKRWRRGQKTIANAA